MPTGSDVDEYLSPYRHANVDGVTVIVDMLTHAWARAVNCERGVGDERSEFADPGAFSW
jgi:hypothetical protein